MQTYSDLKGKVALVSGASSGIGAATARVLAASGARVVLGYFQNEKGAKSTAATIAQGGGTALAVKSDVRTAAGCLGLVNAAVEAFGPIDILVNNAGSLVKRQKILELTEESWDDVMNLNLKSAFLCTQAVAKSMMERKTGNIINVGSIAGRNGGSAGAGAYATAKAGVAAVTKNMAKEFAPANVRVNCISPGVIDTPFHEVFSTPEMIKSFVAGIPQGRVGTADEVAQVVAFLVSTAASYITGQTIEINGGQFML
jgi:3-oxoacyl-[acyl-carrier protein] reductase